MSCQAAFQPGDEAYAFDGFAWVQAGGDQPDQNRQFWKKARVIKTSIDSLNRSITDVVFLDENRRSCNHLSHSLRRPA